jgi:hypothetical protein
MRRWVVFSILALSGAALTWSCSGVRSTGGSKQAQAAPEPQVAYTFLGITADARGEMFPCG